MTKVFRLFLMLIPLIFGSFVYVLFRSEKLLMFQWFQFLNINDFIQSIRISNMDSVFPDWFLYNLPDGLWILSYVLISIEVWNRKINAQSAFWILMIPFVAILSEMLQYFNMLVGTFDILDLTFYILGTLIPFILHKNLNLITIKNYEKK